VLFVVLVVASKNGALLAVPVKLNTILFTEVGELHFESTVMFVSAPDTKRYHTWSPVIAEIGELRFVMETAFTVGAVDASLD
jgi:hypothetical protein